MVKPEKMMKQLFNYLKATSLVLLVLFTYACTTSDDEDPGGGNEPIELSLTDLVGRWGIQSTSTDGGAAQSQVPCRNTLEIHENGNFLVVNADEGTWSEGTASFNQADSILTITVGANQATFKLLSVSETAFQLQFNDDSGSTVVVEIDEFVKLESGDCAGISPAEIRSKWSVEEFGRRAFEITEGERGDLLGTETQDNVPYNMFTIEFKSDGSFVMIDLVNQFDYGMGTYRNLDDHNYVIEFDDDSGNEEEQLVHITAAGEEGLSIMLVETDEVESGEMAIIESTFDLSENDGSEPTLSDEDMHTKWSAVSVAERAFLRGQMVGERVNDQIPHNKLTIEFFDDGGVQLIDLVDEIGVDRGEYMFLDGSNILIDVGDEADDGEEDNFQLFHVVEARSGSITLKSYESEHHDGEGDGAGGGEANDGHDQGGGDLEYDLLTFELVLNQNSGQEPSVSSEELVGNWMVTEVEDLREAGSGDNQGEGPQVGMVLNFASGGTGAVSFQGQEVTTFEYEMLDANNVALIFADGDDGDGDGGESNDGHEDDDNYTIFHVNARPGGAVELILYEPSRDDNHDGGGDGTGGGGEANDGHDQGDGDEENDGGPTYRIVMQKEG